MNRSCLDDWVCLTHTHPRYSQPACREAPRITAARLAPLQANYADAFTNDRKAAGPRLREALADTTVGLQWVWARLPGGCGVQIDFGAPEWTLL